MDFSQYINLGLTPESQQFYNNLSLGGVPSGTGGALSTDTGAGAEAPLAPEEQKAVLERLRASRQPITPPSWHTKGRIIPTKSNFWYATPYNFIRNIGDIGTGLTYTAGHLPELGKQLADFEKKNWENTKREAKILKAKMKDGNATLGDYVEYLGRVAQVNPVNATISGAADLIGQPYAVNTRTLGEIAGTYKNEGIKAGNKAVGQQLKNTAKSVLENPADVLMDFAPAIGQGVKAANKAIAKTGKGYASASGLTAGQQAEKIINVANKEVMADTNRLLDQTKELKKNKNLSDLVKRAEETGDWEGVPIAQREALKKFSDDYNVIAQKHSPQTAVDPEHLTVAQNIARKKNITYRQAEKEITALYDSIPQGVDRNVGLKQLADQGDKLAKQVINARQGFYEGRLFPITHALQEAPEISKEMRAASGIDEAQRLYSGKFSTREFGNASYEDIAKSLANPQEYMERLGRQYVGNNIAKQLLNGTLAGESVVADDLKNASYISREALEKGDILKALDSATDKPLAQDAIPIDKNVANELKKQLKPFGAPFNYQTLNDVYNLGKGNMLAAGTYLGANVIGGGLTSLMASGGNILDDVVNAIATKGKLSKELGTYRNVSAFKDVKTPVLKQLNIANKYTTGAVTELLDRKFQNAFSEIAANRKLREMGVLPENRLKFIEDAQADKIADIIQDVKATSLLNNTKTLLPRGVVETVAVGNPFWRWNDTAARSTLYMLQKHPITSNIILNQVLGRIGFDQEMQNRLNLGVKSDKQNVSYYFDERTGQIKEASIEWIPQMNTFKIISNPKDTLLKDPTSSVTLSRLWNATQGKDAYGRALKRAEKNPTGRITHMYDGAERLVFDENGWHKEETKLDEVLSTFAKESIGVLNLANKTVLPAVGTALGRKYYQPYGQSLFGDFHKDETTNNMLMGGDPRKPRELGDVMSSFAGMYSQPYIPSLQEERPLGVRQGRSLMRGQRYDLLRKQRGY